MEKHGDGPVQYSSNINGMIIELYPSLHGNMPDNSRLGFSYSSLEDTLSKLDKSISVGSIQQSGDRKFVVVKDPDGRNIELVQLRHSVSEAA